jgi:hypothetical protein
VIGTSSGAVTGMRPGRVYRNEMTISVPDTPRGEISCTVEVDIATEPFG